MGRPGPVLSPEALMAHQQGQGCGPRGPRALLLPLLPWEPRDGPWGWPGAGAWSPGKPQPPAGENSQPPPAPNPLAPHPCRQHRANSLGQTRGGPGHSLTLQAWPSSRAALWASAGFSITLPVCPEKSIATREFSETLRCKGEAVDS